MKKIGITGGIGAGKSVVSTIFEQLGIPVFYSDAESKKNLDEDPEVRKEIIKYFGEEIYPSGGMADRRRLAEKVFKEGSKLQQLNSILHPAVFKRFDTWCADQRSPYILKEAAILFESGSEKGLDKVICVSSPEELKITRAMLRDKLSRQDVLDRMSKQLSEEERIKRSDFIIYNDEEQLVIPQVLALHTIFLK